MNKILQILQKKATNYKDKIVHFCLEKWNFDKKHKDTHEFQPLLVEIQDRPLNPLGRSILWIIFGVIVFGLIWLFVGKIDVVVSARGKVVPSGEIKILQPIETGVISKILVKEGDKVQKGQILMQIDPSVTQMSLESKKKDLQVLMAEVKRLQALVQNKELAFDANDIVSLEQYNLFRHQKNTLSQNIIKFEAQKEQAKAQYNSAVSDEHRIKGLLLNEQARLERMEKVLDIIARNQYDEVLKSVHNLSEQLIMSQNKKLEASKHLNEVEQEEKVFKDQLFSTWFEELVQKQKELRLLESEVNAIAFQSKQQQIRATVDGYVGKLLVHTEGGVVTPAEKLISIIPKDAPLIVKATVLNQDIGFVTKNMQSAIKIDTFSFQKYGYLHGEVVNVGNDAIEDEKLGPVYEIKIAPTQTMLMVEGEEKELEPGMSVTAEIKVGKRRIIEFFIYPLIKYMDEGLSVR
jgi:hemolysin D